MKKFIAAAIVAAALAGGAGLLSAPSASANVPSASMRHDAKWYANWYWTSYRGEDNPCPYGVKLKFDRRMPEPGVLGLHYNYTCTIHLDIHRTWWWYRLCGLVTHEMGHVYGHGHSSDYHSIMYPAPMVAGGGRFWSCSSAETPPPGYY